MAKLCSFFLLLFLSFQSISQNLIPNPSFEDYSKCPSEIKQIDRVEKWYSANAGSPEYFNSCGFNGEIDPIDGQGMVGLIFLDDYRSMVEYIQIELVKPLEKDQYYCLNFYVASSSLNPIVTNKVGAYFSKEVLKTPIWEPLIKYPQVKTEEIIEANGKWVKVEGTFKANGGEQFMTIGNFYEAYYLKEEQTFVNTNQVFTYYYYDYFKLFKSNQFCSIEENTPQRMEKEELEHLVYFDSDKYQLSLAELERLSSFIERLEDSRFKQLKIEAHTDTLGSVFYNMILAQQRANSVRQLIDSMSSLATYSIWYGEDKPLPESIGDKDAYNAKSRRVKIIAVE